MTYFILDNNSTFDLINKFWEGPDTLRYEERIPNSILRQQKLGSFSSKEQALDKLVEIRGLEKASPDTLHHILVETILEKECPFTTLEKYANNPPNWLGPSQALDFQKNASTFSEISNIRDWLLSLDRYERPRLLKNKFERLTLKKARLYIDKIIGDY